MVLLIYNISVLPDDQKEFPLLSLPVLPVTWWADAFLVGRQFPLLLQLEEGEERAPGLVVLLQDRLGVNS